MADIKQDRSVWPFPEPILELECSNCKIVVRTADDLGYGFKGKPYVGATHVCDRFEYGSLRIRYPNHIDWKEVANGRLPPRGMD